MYSNCLSTRDILDEIYDFGLDAATVSKIIDRIMPNIEELKQEDWAILCNYFY